MKFSYLYLNQVHQIFPLISIFFFYLQVFPIYNLLLKIIFFLHSILSHKLPMLISFLACFPYTIKKALHLYSEIFLLNFYFCLFMVKTNFIPSTNLFRSAKIISYIANNFSVNDEVLPNKTIF